MNRLFLFLCVILLNCDNSKKEVEFGKMNEWEHRGITLIKTEAIFNNDQVYKMYVIPHDETYTFVAINNIKINYTGGKYRISLAVKGNTENSNLGLRIQGVHPTRLDVVFDLSKESVVGVYKEGDVVENEKVLIEPLIDGWFECSIEADIHASYFRLLFGPTNVTKGQINVWESENLNDDGREILILPESLKIEEIKD